MSLVFLFLSIDSGRINKSMRVSGPEDHRSEWACTGLKDETFGNLTTVAEMTVGGTTYIGLVVMETEEWR